MRKETPQRPLRTPNSSGKKFPRRASRPGSEVIQEPLPFQPKIPLGETRRLSKTMPWTEKKTLENHGEERFGISSFAFHPRHKTNTCRNYFLGKSFSREYMRGLYLPSRVAEYRKILFRDHIPQRKAKFLREFISVRRHVVLVFAPARIQKKILANCLCIGFVPGSTKTPNVY